MWPNGRLRCQESVPLGRRACRPLVRPSRIFHNRAFIVLFWCIRILVVIQVVVMLVLCFDCCVSVCSSYYLRDFSWIWIFWSCCGSAYCKIYVFTIRLLIFLSLMILIAWIHVCCCCLLNVCCCSSCACFYCCCGCLFPLDYVLLQ